MSTVQRGLDAAANYLQGYAIAEKEKDNPEGEEFWLTIARRVRSLDITSETVSVAWSDDRPTREGWYWVSGILNLPQIVKLVDMRGSLYVVYAGSATTDPLEADHFNNARWYGPITAPPEE